ncbi:MAG: FkbM family methyltransferase [Elusimicrobia bacterium]|nr:FkbM family methyltransferase [Candidatus Obscuribacterium magneticum]
MKSIHKILRFFISFLHAIKRTVCRRVDLERIPLLRPLRRALIAYAKPSQITIHGHIMRVDKNDSLGLAWYREFEPLETLFFQREAKPGQVIVDVGANIGYYTLMFARAVGGGGHVYAFEPEPSNGELLRKNIELNGYRNVTPIGKAAADRTGHTRLFLSGQNLGDHRTFDSKEEKRGSIEIETVSLDDYFERLSPAIDVVKMDIQGGEYHALRGMRNIIQRNPKLMIVAEFWPYGLSRSGVQAKDMLQLLREAGFQLYQILEKARKIRPADDETLLREYGPDNFDHTNLLCLKTGLPAWINEL